MNLSLVKAAAKPQQLTYAYAATVSMPTTTTVNTKTTTAVIKPKSLKANSTLPTSPAAIDQLMSHYGGASPVAGDSNERLLSELLAPLPKAG